MSKGKHLKMDFHVSEGEAEKGAPVTGGVHKTVNSHSSSLCCGYSCILSCYVIIWSQTDLQILICRTVRRTSVDGGEFLEKRGCILPQNYADDRHQ